MDSVLVLEEDPDLGRWLGAEEHAAAAAVLRAPVARWGRGPLDPATLAPAEPPTLGLLVLEGFVVREVVVAGRRFAELLDDGDILRPWDPADEDAALTAPEASWTVLVPLRLAVLDRAFAQTACRWPGLVEGLMTRMLRRSRWLAALLAINGRPRVDNRLLALLWHMADRWGRVTPAGVVLPLPLTHDLLARLVGAGRPTVSSALTTLAERRLAERRPDSSWLLHRRDAWDVTSAPGGRAL